VVKHSEDSVYDALLLPALTYAERDQGEGRLSAEEKQGIVDATRELISDAETARRARQPDVAPSPDPPATERVMVLGLPAHTDADRVALEILAKLLEGTPFVLQIASVHALSSDAVAVGRRYLHGASGAAPDHQVGPLARVVEGPLGREVGRRRTASSFTRTPAKRPSAPRTRGPLGSLGSGGFLAAFAFM
jgi:hypothetical protein